MTYEPYLSTVREKPEAGKIIATTLDYPMVMDTFGCTPKFINENPKLVQAHGQRLLRRRRDDPGQEPKKSFEIMGAVVKQTGEQFEKSQSYLRWQDREANKKFFAGDLQAFSRRRPTCCSSSASSRPCRTPRDHRHPLHQVSAPAVRPLVPVSPPPPSPSGSRSSSCSSPLWAVATLGGFVNRTFLADPLTMLVAGWRLLVVHGFYEDIGVTIWRVFGGFVLAAAIGVPLGIAMGAYKAIEAFFEPFVSFARYLPASAFIPLLILWAGIGETQKLLVIFIGSFFQLVLMVAVIVGGTRRDLVEAAYTLGARSGGIVRRVLLPVERARHRRDAAAGAGLGVDVRDRGRADRKLQRYRPHDHRQPGAARHRTDHLRHRGDRPDRARLRLRLQAAEPPAVPLESGLMRVPCPAC